MWYREGTKSLKNGSATVTGIGTSWAKTENGVLPGMILLGKSGEPYEIKSVESDTSLTLVEPYSGVTAANIPCRIITTYQGDISQFAARFAAQLQRMNIDSGVIRAWLTSGQDATLLAEDGTEITLKALRQIIAEHEDAMTWFSANQDAILTAASSASKAASSASAASSSQKAAKTSETNAASSASAAASSKAATAISETNAAKSVTSAATSEANAKTSESNAAASAKSASASATSATASKSAAATSESNAATSESNAAASATSATGSKTASATSATNAAKSATAAKTSETNAANSETSSKASENASAASQSNAAASASNAATSETNAGKSATAAKTSETNAASSKSSAATSATNAKASESSAATSQAAAATSETNASASESKAATSATNASKSETNAKSSENAAASSKSSAASSASAAKTSESNAASSASSAAASAKSINSANIWNKDNLVLQANPVDRTADSVMKVGAFGLGTPSYVLSSSVTSLADATATEGNTFWTLSGKFEDGPLAIGASPMTVTGQMLNMRRWYDAGGALVQMLFVQGGAMYLRSGSGGTGKWTWNGMSAGSDANGWRKVMDSATISLADIVALGVAKSGVNSDITSLNGLTSINTNTLTVSKNLEAGSQILSGYRLGAIRSDAYPAYMVFARQDQVDGTPPTAETGVMNIWGRLASTTSDQWAGRTLGGVVVSNMPHGGGKTYLDARDSKGSVTSKFWLDGGDGSANFSGAGGLKASSLIVDGDVQLNGMLYANRHDSCISFSSKDGTQPILQMNYSSAGNFGIWDATNSQWVLRKDTSNNWYVPAGSLNVSGPGNFTSDAIGVQLQPATKDKSYYIRGKKSDGSLHWYLGQSSDNTNTVTLGNTIAGTWLTLLADGNGSSNVKTMTYNNALEVNGGMRVAHPNGALTADSTNAAMVVGGSATDGSQGLTVNSFAPTVAFVDRSTNSTAFRWRGDANYLRLDVDNKDNGATWNNNKAIFTQTGSLALGGSGASAGVMLMLGYNAAGNGALTGSSQYGAATHFNIGAEASVRAVSYLSEMTLGDGATEQTLGDWVDFWANSQTVNDKAAVTLSSAFRAYDKTSPSVKTTYAFDGRMMTRSGVNRWNLYMQGSAPNFIRGQTIVGGTDVSLPDSVYNLEVRGGQRVTGDLVVEGMIYSNKNNGGITFTSVDGSGPVYNINYSSAGNFGFWDKTNSVWLLRNDANNNWIVPAGFTAAKDGSFGGNLSVTSELDVGYRVNIMRSNGYVPYQNFVRGDLPSDVNPTAETAVGQIFFKTASATSDAYAGRNLGLLQVNMTKSGGGKLFLDSRNQAGSVTSRIILDGDSKLMSVNGDILSDGKITTKDNFDSSRISYVASSGGRYFDSKTGNQLSIGDDGVFDFTHVSKGKVFTVDSAKGTANLAGSLTTSTNITVTGSGASNLSIGSGASDVYMNNSKSGKYLQLKDTGELMYSSQEVYHAGNKPTAVDVGALPLGGGTVTGPIVSTDANGFRIKVGNVASFMRSDGSNTYFLLTNSGDQNGSWNSLRPIYWNNASGAVTMGHDVTVGGTLTGNGNASFNDVYIRSDRRNKRKIAKIDGALDKLEKIDGVLYELQGIDGYNQSAGLVAQQVQEVQPELVTSDIDPISQEERLRLNYNGVIGMLVEAVKELRAEVKELREAAK